MAQPGAGGDDPFGGDVGRAIGGDGGSCKEESFDPAGSSEDEGGGPLDQFLSTKPSANSSLDGQATPVSLRRQAYEVADKVWSNFHALQDKNLTGAFRQLISDLSKYGGLLNTTNVMSMENQIKIILNIKDNLKGNAAEQGRSPLEEVRLFLNDEAVN
jgi:hypothetical protein